MNRKIKFRGKRIDNKEWIIGDLISLSKIDPFSYISKGIGYKVDDPEIGKPIKVYPHTIGLLTGLKDKNDKEIFEGDIAKIVNQIEVGNEIIGLVEWCNEFSCFELKVLIGGEEGTMTVYSKQVDHRNINREVIGNIHDNPELIPERNNAV